MVRHLFERVRRARARGNDRVGECEENSARSSADLHRGREGPCIVWVSIEHRTSHNDAFWLTFPRAVLQKREPRQYQIGYVKVASPADKTYVAAITEGD